MAHILDLQEDPKSRSPNSGLQYSYGLDYGTFRWIYLLDASRGVGCWASGVSERSSGVGKASALPAAQARTAGVWA